MTYSFYIINVKPVQPPVNEMFSPVSAKIEKGGIERLNTNKGIGEKCTRNQIGFETCEI